MRRQGRWPSTWARACRCQPTGQVLPAVLWVAFSGFAPHTLSTVQCEMVPLWPPARALVLLQLPLLLLAVVKAHDSSVATSRPLSSRSSMRGAASWAARSTSACSCPTAWHRSSPSGSVQGNLQRQAGICQSLWSPRRPSRRLYQLSWPLTGQKEALPCVAHRIICLRCAIKALRRY